MSRWLIGTKRNKRRCLYENEDVVVEHFVADFQDGTTEAVLTVHLLKDGIHIVTVWSSPSDAFVDGLIMCTIGSGHHEAFYGGKEGSKEAVLV
ncbi:hypothetical protein GN278_10950 [Rhodobacteraceae bacterium Araon29]